MYIHIYFIYISTTQNIRHVCKECLIFGMLQQLGLYFIFFFNLCDYGIQGN